MMEEKLYFSPSEFPGSHSQAFQAAVDAAMASDVRVVAVSGNWHLTESVKLPAGITVILDSAIVECESVAFESAPAPRTLSGEQNIFLLGRNGAKLQGLSQAPQVKFSNCRDCRIADLTFEGGNGIEQFHIKLLWGICLYLGRCPKPRQKTFWKKV